MSLQLPDIHMNGTSKEALVDALCDASFALNAAYEALKQTAPNGRDYYTLGPLAIGHATNQHMSRLRRLDDIKREIDTIIEGVEAQAK